MLNITDLLGDLNRDLGSSKIVILGRQVKARQKIYITTNIKTNTSTKSTVKASITTYDFIARYICTSISSTAESSLVSFISKTSNGLTESRALTSLCALIDSSH